MESITNNPPLIVIAGQTATGKTSLALQLAQQFGGEIIAADSRTVYQGMDIGTAKPSLAEQRQVPHHLIDVVRPNQSFTVADFQRLAQRAITDIGQRGKVPILVGGTGLYIDATIYNFRFRPPAQPARRAQLSTLSVTELQHQLQERGIALPPNQQNPRHLIRALETAGAAPRRSGLRPNTLILGLLAEKAILEQRIRQRVDSMVQAGFVTEVRSLAATYGWEAAALQAPGYKAFRPYLAGAISLEAAKQQFVRNDLQYAKRQKTWFKRNNRIHWISKPEEAVDLVTTLLNK